MALLRSGKSKLLSLILISLLCLILAAVVVYFAVIVPNRNYELACTLKEQAKYDQAQDVFEALGNYKDSAAQAEACRLAILDIAYDNALALVESGHLLDGHAALLALNGYKDSAEKADALYSKWNAKMQALQSVAVGDTVLFGVYEQDNDLTNGKEDIEWLVLDILDGKALVISKHALDCKPFYWTYLPVSWETSTLRTWLNEDFIEAAFCVEENAMIPEVDVAVGENPTYGTKAGNATRDRVYLLSIEEASRYFASESQRKCEPTAYATAKGAYTSTESGLCCWWWLRSPGFLQFRTALVLNDGVVYEHGDFAAYGTGTVRPVMWIDLNSIDLP